MTSAPATAPAAPAAATAVRAVDLGKRYRDAWGLRGCSFDVPAGRVVGLVGPNGAGKTTLISLIAGLARPTEGLIEVRGAPPRGHADVYAARIAYVAQEKPLYAQLRVKDVLEFGRRMNRVWDENLATRWLRTFDVPFDRRCGNLSGGQQAQVALAVALGSRPDLLLLDEPLANLDPLVRSDVVRGLLDTVSESGVTVLMSTHVVAELHGVIDHLVVLNGGAVVLDGDVDTLLSRHTYVSGPAAERAPVTGDVVHATHAPNQSTFLVRDGGRLPEVGGQRWVTRAAPLEQLILDYLRSYRTEPKDGA